MGSSMDLLQGLATAKTLQPKVGEAWESQPAAATTPATILLLAIGIGLIAGFLDLGMLMVKLACRRRGFII